jgi:hypothetical protein
MMKAKGHCEECDLEMEVVFITKDDIFGEEDDDDFLEHDLISDLSSLSLEFCPNCGAELDPREVIHDDE